ncbi:MAG: HDOD domain-containing protein [Planctomycetes bacterium]|nr:HDOD domain-containing protein [Planctomycetota bacterium]
MWKIITGWLSALTGRSASSQRTTVVIRSRPTPGASPAAHASAQPAETSLPEAGAVTSKTQAADAASAPALPSKVEKAPGAAQPKARASEYHTRGDGYLEERERELLARLSNRIARGDLELPQLPSTSLAVIDMTSKNSVEIADIVRAIESDPVLSSEIVKTANSALYSGAEAVETISASVVRIGMRNLRTLMFSLSMRSAVLRDKRLSSYAEEVWRQAYSTASIARGIAKPLGADPDRAFLQGLLADIGKVSLLAMLRKELPKGSDVSPALVGRVFYLFHEIAGGRLAEAWHMPADIVSIAACHHRYSENQHNQRDAALVSLALRLDMLLGHDYQDSADAMTAPEMDFLELTPQTRQAAVDAAMEARELAAKVA